MFTDQLFQQHLANLGALPSWWLAAKRAAWDQFQQLPPPARTDETWRFSNTRTLDIANFTPAQNTQPTLGQFNNTDLTPAPLDKLPPGVIFRPLATALRDHPDIIRHYFQKLPANLGSEKFVALNTALTNHGALLHVPDNTRLPHPLVIRHTLTGENTAYFPHTLVILGKNATATLIETFANTDGTPTRQLVSGVNDLHAAENAQLTYIGTQNWSRNTLSLHANSTVAERDARILSLNLHLGARQARHESHSRLLGPGAHSEMLALTIATGEQEFDQRTLQTHAAPHTSSNLLYKNALLDTAKTIFSGLIIVEPDAQKTDAYQSNRNLMLSPGAESNSLPGLEIQANDVRCTHGSTSSNIEPEQLFYLKARGIPPALAEELLIFGFFEEVLNKITDEKIHAALQTQLRQKLENQ